MKRMIGNFPKGNIEVDVCRESMDGTDDFELEVRRNVNFLEEPEARELEKEEGHREREDQGNKIPVIQREGATTAERQADLVNAISWLRKELQEMQSQDKHLARQMICLRAKIKKMMRAGDSMVDDLCESDAMESIDSGISTM